MQAVPYSSNLVITFLDSLSRKYIKALLFFKYYNIKMYTKNQSFKNYIPTGHGYSSA